MSYKITGSAEMIRVEYSAITEANNTDERLILRKPENHLLELKSKGIEFIIDGVASYEDNVLILTVKGAEIKKHIKMFAGKTVDLKPKLWFENQFHLKKIRNNTNIQAKIHYIKGWFTIKDYVLIKQKSKDLFFEVR